MISEEERGHALEVLAVLQRIDAEFRSIEDRISEKRTLDPGVKEGLQRDLETLKNSLRILSARGTIDEARKQASRIEGAFFQPAVHHAIAHFKVRIGSDPIRSDWISALYEPHEDVTHLIYELSSYLSKQDQ